MRNRKLKTIARRWWNAEGGDYDWERVDHVVRERHDLVPRLIKALSETAPPGCEPYIGCVIVENLEILAEFEGRQSSTLRIVLASGLRKEPLVKVLSGAYSTYLEAMNIREGLAGVLEPDEIDWLLDDASPGRFEYPASPLESESRADGT